MRSREGWRADWASTVGWGTQAGRLWVRWRAMAEGALFERLIARYPLPEEGERGRVASGLAEAAAAYAKQGSYEGAEGPWWRVWRALERGGERPSNVARRTRGACSGPSSPSWPGSR
jgi:hypothetical protein